VCGVQWCPFRTRKTPTKCVGIIEKEITTAVSKVGPVFIMSSVRFIIFFSFLFVFSVSFAFFFVIIINLRGRIGCSCFGQRRRRGNDGQYAPGFASSSPDFLCGQLPTKFLCNLSRMEEKVIWGIHPRW